MRVVGKHCDLIVNGKEYIRSPGHKAHDVDYFHHFDRRSSFGEDYANERRSPDTQTKVTLYDPVRHMKKLVNHDFKSLMQNSRVTSFDRVVGQQQAGHRQESSNGFGLRCSTESSGRGHLPLLAEGSGDPERQEKTAIKSKAIHKIVDEKRKKAAVESTRVEGTAGKAADGKQKAMDVPAAAREEPAAGPNTYEMRRLVQKKYSQFNLNVLDLSQRTKQGRKIMAEVKKRQLSRLEHLYSHKNMLRTSHNSIRKDAGSATEGQQDTALASPTRCGPENRSIDGSLDLRQAQASPAANPIDEGIEHERTHHLKLKEMNKKITKSSSKSNEYQTVDERKDPNVEMLVTNTLEPDQVSGASVLEKMKRMKSEYIKASRTKGMHSKWNLDGTYKNIDGFDKKLSVGDNLNYQNRSGAGSFDPTDIDAY